MLNVRPHKERGLADFGWLHSQHTFSFGNYFDPEHMGFGPLRVINEDRVQPAQGFGTHGHKDMEIISYVIEGALEHKDSMGNGSIIRPGDVQRMSAGTGIKHSEYNHSKTETVHFLQIWILPERSGLTPSYEQNYFSATDKQGRLCLIGSRDGRLGSVTMHKDVDLYAAHLAAGESVVHELPSKRRAWVQVVRGQVAVNRQNLTAGDGVAVSDIDELSFSGLADSELLLFDMS